MKKMLSPIIVLLLLTYSFFVNAQVKLPSDFAPMEDPIEEETPFKPKEKQILKPATTTIQPKKAPASPQQNVEQKKEVTQKPENQPTPKNTAPQQKQENVPEKKEETQVLPSPPPPTESPVQSLDKIPVLQSRQFFGIWLGEKITNVVERAKAADLECYESGTSYNVDLIKYKEHTITGSLDKNKEIASTVINSYEGRVCIVRAYFKDTRESFIDSLKKTLTQKYGNPTEETKDTYPQMKEQNFYYEGTIEGRKILIQLTIFRNIETSAVLKFYVKYAYKDITDIHDSKIPKPNN